MSALTRVFIVCALLMALCGGAIFNTTKAEAAFNAEINYQGKLTNSSNAAVADGEYDIEFNLYTVASGGVAIWTETQTVHATSGLFSVMLGDISSLSGVDFNQTLYLGVTIEADSEMAPRKVLGAVPAAFQAQELDGFTASQFLRSDEPDTMASTSVMTLLTVTQSGTGNILDLKDGATTIFTAKDGGHIGIGTTTTSGARLTVQTSGTTDILNLLETGGTEVFTVLESGNVGIGDTSPSALLTVGTGDAFQVNSSGAIAAATGITSSGTITFSGLTSGLLYANGSGVLSATSTLALSLIPDKFLRNDADDTTTGQLTAANFVGSSSSATSTLAGSFAVETNGLVYDRTTNFVGIGTAAPATVLHLSKATAGTQELLRLHNSSTNAAATADIRFRLGSSGNDTGFINQGWNGSAMYLSLGAGSPAAEGIRIVGGRVGIGTSTPAAELQVLSTTEQLRVAYNASNYYTTTVGSTGGVTLDAVGSGAGFTLSDSLTMSGTSANILLGSNWISGDGDDEGLYVASDGDVGVGTSSPLWELHVDKTQNKGTYLNLTNYSSGASAQAGVYGQTDSASYLAIAHGSGRTTQRYGFAVGGWAEMLSLTGSGLLVGTGANATPIVFGTNSTERMRILSDGNVGIGTTSPLTKLSVQGSSRITGDLSVAGITATSTVTGLRFIASSATATSTLPVLSVTGRLYDASGKGGTSGMVLQSTGTGINWVATSTLGITAGGAGDVTAVGDCTTGACFDGTSGTTLTFNNAGGDKTLVFDGSNFTFNDGLIVDTLDTGQGANELYDMDQNVLTTSDVTFNSLTLTTDLSVANGGTGASTLTGLLLGNGTSPFTATTSLSSSYIEDAYVRNTGDSISGNLTFSGSAANIALGSNYLSGDGDDEGIFVSSAGNVGIGTSSPLTKLSVQGDSRITGNLQVAGLTATSTVTFGTLTDALIVTNSSGVLAEYAGTSCPGQFVQSLSALGVASCASGGGSIATSTALANTQMIYATGVGTIGSEAAFTYDASTNTLTVDVLALSGTGTLNGVDVIDATTESTIEAAIDTLANLTAASSLATVGTITSGVWNGTDIAVSDGGTGASTLTGLLQGNGTGAITGITGTAGQVPYYNGTNTLLATSSIFIASDGKIGIGTTSPEYRLEVADSTSARIAVTQKSNNAVAPGFEYRKIRGTGAVTNGDFLGLFSYQGYDGDQYLRTAHIAARINGTVANNSIPTDLIFAAGSTDDPTVSNEVMRVTSGGTVAIGTTTSVAKLSILNASNPQLQLGQSGSLYTRMQVAASTGDMTLSLSTGQDIYMTQPGGSTGANLWVCEGDTCPSVTLTDGGNIVAEGAYYFSNGYYMKEASSTAVGLYDDVGDAIILFDDGT